MHQQRDTKQQQPPLQPPLHVAIIMDGNGRWAEQRGFQRNAGHAAGAQSVRRVLKAAPGMGIDAVTLYSFSSENWRRPDDEVNALMELIRSLLLNELGELRENGVRVAFIGDRAPLPQGLRDAMAHAEHETADQTRLTLTLAINYGSRDEIVRAVRTIAKRAAAGELDPNAIGERDIANTLDTAQKPEPDILIRTAGEQRLSNFLLWQCSYTELRFTDTLWPDFDEKDLRDAVDDLRGRTRRFGGLPETTPKNDAHDPLKNPNR